MNGTMTVELTGMELVVAYEALAAKLCADWTYDVVYEVEAQDPNFVLDKMEAALSEEYICEDEVYMEARDWHRGRHERVQAQENVKEQKEGLVGLWRLVEWGYGVAEDGDYVQEDVAWLSQFVFNRVVNTETFDGEELKAEAKSFNGTELEAEAYRSIGVLIDEELEMAAELSSVGIGDWKEYSAMLVDLRSRLVALYRA